MLKKPRTKPYQVLCYEALFRRLKPQYRDNETIRSDFRKYDAGYSGETHVDYVLSTASLKNAATYCDIRLAIGPHDFQIDTLIATPSVMIIIETKNFTGELKYDHRQDQFIQMVNAEKKRMTNPLLQSETQKRHLKAWLELMNMPNIPIETLSVISNPNAILFNTDPDSDVFDRLIHRELLPKRLHHIARTNKRTHYNAQTLKRLHHLILRHDSPRHPDLIRQYDLKDHHFIQGIACPACEHWPMKRLREKWHCPKCDSNDKAVHERAIYDHFLLFKTPMTNQACRRLLQVTRPSTAHTLLNAMNLKRMGNTSNTTYQPPVLTHYPQDSYFPGKWTGVPKL